VDVSHNKICVNCRIKIKNLCFSSLEGKNTKISRYFLERESYKSDESKRPGPSISSSELLGFEVSFRKLDVD